MNKLRTAVAAAALVLAIVSAAGLPELLSQVHFATVDDLVDGQSTSSDSANFAPDPGSPPTNVVLNLTLSSSTLDGNYTFELKSGSRLLRDLEGDMTDNERGSFVDQVLGYILVRDGGSLFVDPDISGRELTYAPPEISRASEATLATVVIKINTFNIGAISQIAIGKPAIATGNPDGSLIGLAKMVKVDTGPAGRISTPYEEDRLNSEQPHQGGVFAVPMDQSFRALRFELETSAQRVTTGSFLNGQGNVALPPPLESLAFCLLIGLPLIILLALLGTHAIDLGEFQPTALKIIRLTLAFHVAVWATQALSLTADLIRQQLSNSFLQNTDNRLPSRSGTLGLLVFFGVVLWPNAIWALCKAHNRKRRVDTSYRPPVLGILGAAIIGVFLAILGNAFPTTRVRTIAIGIGLAISLWVIVRVTVGRRALWDNALQIVAGVALLVGSAFYVPVLFAGQTDWTRHLNEASLIVFAATTTCGLGVLFGRLTIEATIEDGARGAKSATIRRLWKIVPTLALVILVAPSVSNIARDHANPLNPFSLLEFAFALDAIVYFPAVVCLFILLRRASAEDNHWSNPAVLRTLGIAVLLLLVFSRSGRWFYLPLPFLLSWLLASVLLLPSGRTTQPATGRAQDPARLRTLLDAQIVGNRLRSMRQKYRSGDPAVANYNTQVKFLESQRDALRQEAWQEGDPYLLPPASSPWESGKRGLAYGFLFSVPSMALYLYHQFVTSAPGDHYAILYLLGADPFYALQWAIYGFFLGYFFELIRGRTGLEKAAWLFLVLLVLNVFEVLLSSSPDWISLLFWALQTFIQLIIVGVIVGDYQIARRADLGWRDLIEIHDVRWVAAWGASIAAAIGGVTLTLFSTAAGDLYRAVLPTQAPGISTTVTTTPPSTTTSLPKK